MTLFFFWIQQSSVAFCSTFISLIFSINTHLVVKTLATISHSHLAIHCLLILTTSSTGLLVAWELFQTTLASCTHRTNTATPNSLQQNPLQLQTSNLPPFSVVKSKPQPQPQTHATRNPLRTTFDHKARSLPLFYHPYHHQHHHHHHSGGQ